MKFVSLWKNFLSFENVLEFQIEMNKFNQSNADGDLIQFYFTILLTFFFGQTN